MYFVTTTFTYFCFQEYISILQTFVEMEKELWAT